MTYKTILDTESIQYIIDEDGNEVVDRTAYELLNEIADELQKKRDEALVKALLEPYR